MKLRTWINPASVLIALGLIAFAVLALTGAARLPDDGKPPVLPDPMTQAAIQADAGLQTAVFAGGCFWGVEAVFEHVKGVHKVESGYAGGSAASATYYAVSAGQTGHAEVVRVRFDPRKVSYGQLLKVLFEVAHDPTQLNRQGPDRGRQYRSAIFTTNAGQDRAARAYIEQLTRAGVFGKRPIVTQVAPLKAFYMAEAEHQDFARRNPSHPYIVRFDAPKVTHLQRAFPALFTLAR